MATVRGNIYDAVVAKLEADTTHFAHVIAAPDEDVSISALTARESCNGKAVLEVFLGEDSVQSEGQGHNMDALDLPVVIAAHIGAPAEGDTGSLEARACTLMGAVYDAMMDDPQWTTDGVPQAIDTRVQSFSSGVMFDNRDGVGTRVAVAMYSVRYRFLFKSPGTPV